MSGSDRNAGSLARQPLRSRLFMLAASGILPLVIAAMLGTAYLIHERRQDAQRSALELSRALATAVDSELKSIVGVLESLALSADRGSSSPAQFDELARQIVQQRSWRGVLLADAGGNVVWSSIRGMPDAPLAGLIDPASMKLALASRMPVIGQVRAGQRQPGSAFAVRVPVIREGQLVNVLSAIVDTEQILNVLNRQKVPATWVASVFDQDSTRVARTKVNTTARPAPSLQALLDTGAPEGMGPTHTLEGVPSFSGYTRLKDSGWTIAVGISAAEVDNDLLPLLLSLGAGLLASLALAAYLAWVYARRVSEPIRTLKNAADALGRGERVALRPLDIAELDEVGTALSQASAEREAALAERLRAGEERERLLARVTEALRLAEEAGRDKDRFLALLAHELRNPLAPIRNAVQILRISAGCNSGQAGQLLPMMERQLSHMARLLDDLLDVSRIANGKIELRKERIDVAQAVQAAVEASKPLIDSMGHQISVSFPPESLMVDADPVRVAQMISNLLDNAAHYSTPGGRIYLSAGREGCEVRLAVKDSGIGIPAEHLDSIFGLFVQVGQPCTPRQGGLGVGLSLVRTMADLHGGRVEARSPGPGLGSEFIVSLPAAADQAANEPLSGNSSWGGT